MRLLFVFGTRPEAIKLLPLIKCFQSKHAKNFKIKVCSTGQQKEMLDQVLKEFDYTPDYDFALMKQQQSLSDITSSILTHLPPILSEFLPKFVIVHGDTTTAMTACLAAYYCKIDVIHIESGLRSHNIVNT